MFPSVPRFVTVNFLLVCFCRSSPELKHIERILNLLHLLMLRWTLLATADKFVYKSHCICKTSDFLLRQSRFWLGMTCLRGIVLVLLAILPILLLAEEFAGCLMALIQLRVMVKRWDAYWNPQAIFDGPHHSLFFASSCMGVKLWAALAAGDAHNPKTSTFSIE